MLSWSPEKSLYLYPSCLLPRNPVCQSFLGVGMIRDLKSQFENIHTYSYFGQQEVKQSVVVPFFPVDNKWHNNTFSTFVCAVKVIIFINIKEWIKPHNSTHPSGISLQQTSWLSSLFASSGSLLFGPGARSKFILIIQTKRGNVACFLLQSTV